MKNFFKVTGLLALYLCLLIFALASSTGAEAQRIDSVPNSNKSFLEKKSMKVPQARKTVATKIPRMVQKPKNSDEYFEAKLTKKEARKLYSP
jgi:hypothetical protein